METKKIFELAEKFRELWIEKYGNPNNSFQKFMQVQAKYFILKRSVAIAK